MEQEKPRFFKGLPRFTRSDNALLARDAEESIYFWWWQFLRLSPVFWFAREFGYKLVDPQMATVFDLAGDLGENNFSIWWNKTGVNIFPENKRPARIQVLDLDHLNQHLFDQNSIYLEVPLTIRKEVIFKQLKNILDEVHLGRGLDVTKTANADFKLYTKRYRLRVIEQHYWVLLYRLLHEQIKVWRIGDRLQLAPHLYVRNIDRIIAQKKFHQLTSLTGRYLYKARYTLLNVERNSFPNTSKIIVPDDFKPFGKKRDHEYRTATGMNEGVKSLWNKWLHDQYATLLRQEIVKRNRVDQQVKMPDSRIRKRLPEFIIGESDLLN